MNSDTFWAHFGKMAFKIAFLYGFWYICLNIFFFFKFLSKFAKNRRLSGFDTQMYKNYNAMHPAFLNPLL